MEGVLLAPRSVVFEQPHAMAEMNSYYKWCMFFMSVIGLWPYTSKKLRIFQNGIVSLTIWIFITAQFLAFFTIEKNLFSLLRSASFIILTVASCTRYHIAWYQINDVKRFLDQIKLDWKTNNEEILRIMQIHTSYGRRLVIIFAACIAVVYQISPLILDKIAPLNESRPRNFPIEAEFWIDEEQHPILNIFLIYLSLVISISVLVGAESLMIMMSSHVAGLFHVASYHFQKAVLVESSASCLRRDCTNSKSTSYIVNGVIAHRMALQLGRDANSHCEISYVPSIICGVIGLSIYLFYLSQAVLRSADIRETILSVFLLTSTLGYMFWMNLAVEYTIDSADSISLTTYNTNWYETSVATQKLLQLIILISNRGLAYNFFSVYVPSIEGFAVLLKASVSYFTVLLSLQ